jgi:hypothetical protein
MSILIVGADRINALIPRLVDLGVTRITHWSGRTPNTTRNAIPTHVEAVLFFTDFLHHTAARKLKEKAKSCGLPVIHCRRCWSELADKINTLSM